MRPLVLALAVTLAGCVGTVGNPDGGGGSGGSGGATGGAGGSTGGSGGATGGSGGATGGAGGAGGAAAGSLFATAVPWTQDISAAPLAADSATIISELTTLGGWGATDFRTDDSIVLLEADATTPRVTVNENPAGYYLPDCETLPATIPVPAVGSIEGETGYVCTGGGDCHLLIISRAEHKLYELYQANQTTSGGPLTATCLVVWDLAKTYTSALRGEQCTSADAAGLPITGLLPTPEEVFAGEVPHALRFILPNPRMQASVYVHPATHAGGPSGPGTAPPYGVRFRLKASFDENSLPSAGARVLARALKKYGMILSDGGNIPITIASDRFRAHTWAEVGITDSHALGALTPADFEVVEYGTRIPLTYSCVRAP